VFTLKAIINTISPYRGAL